ncbi:hypothetical protein VAG18_002906 [Escherichia coli]|nr:hypothetical protein [Escherichia coli]
MKVKILDSNFYIGQEAFVDKVFTARRNTDFPDLVRVRGKDLIAQGASTECFDEKWSYNFALGIDAEIVTGDGV